MPTYGSTSEIPTTEVTVESGSTVSISLGFNATVGLVGSYDDDNGSATAGEVVQVSSTRDARDKFGADSELHRAVEQAYANGAVTVYAVALPVTETTESVSGSSGTLTNVPLFDPRVTTHEITVQDTTDASSETVVVNYSDSLSAGNSGEFVVNPLTGDYNDDGDGNDYDITYEYTTSTEYSDAVTNIADENLRYLALLTEVESRINEGVTEAETRDDDFNFFRVIGGVTPETDPDNYDNNIDSQRCALVAPPRAYDEDNESGEVRTVATYAGKLTGKPLGDSTTFETLDNLVDLNQKFANSEIEKWLNAGDNQNFTQVTPLKQDTGIKVIKDHTTSSDAKFNRIFATEIVDEATEGSHQISENYIGELNSPANRRVLEDQHVTLYNSFIDNIPPLLDDFDVAVSENDTNVNAVDVEIGLDVVNVIDKVNVNITVGDIITNEQG